MITPLHVDLIALDRVFLPVVLFQGRQWVPLQLLAEHTGLDAGELQTLAEDATLAQGAMAVLPIQGQRAPLLCLNRTDLPLLLARLVPERFNEASARLWQAHSTHQLATDAALNELHLMELERVNGEAGQAIH